MSVKKDPTDATEAPEERIARIQATIESVIPRIGEHPEYELKEQWRRNHPALKTEFIRDILSIINSEIPEGKDRFLVIGVNEKSKEFTGCDHNEFDDDKIRQLCEAFLDPLPEFEVLRFVAPNTQNYVVIRFPHQPGRPFITKREIKEDEKLHLQAGEIWFKPGGPNTPGSGKRRVFSHSDLVNLINIEPRVQREVYERLERMLPAIRLEALTSQRPQAINSVSVHTSTDEEFESFVEQLLAGSDEFQLNIVIEKLRDKTVEIWKAELPEFTRFSTDDILRIKKTEFVPAMHRLTLLGLLLIKFSARQTWFTKVADLLIEIFEASHLLAKKVESPGEREHAGSLDEHASHTVPAYESLLSAYLLAGYEQSRNWNDYTPSLFSRVVEYVADADFRDRKYFYMFWPVTSAYGGPEMGRPDMVLERFANVGRIARFFNGANGMREAVLQVDCLIEWNSFLSFSDGEPETAKYFQDTHPNTSTVYYPDFVYEEFSRILPFVNRLWSVIRTEGEKNYWLVLPGLADVMKKIGGPRREYSVGKFLNTSAKEQSQRMWANNRMPFRIIWPPEIEDLVKRVRESEAAKRQTR